ncbi:hypothetical protein N7492_007096 [Penicillium capsulatum]|uniref:Transcription factor domain-containing protein n=1 Tax=Penicillium capsulatum TaxID=69766 RepID=A0A9W9LLC6_9EURO|nr:hypothetical protein N7492_007096 [Penicillium capsulatum]KAJ6116932.1 hypothetical protein N7512_006657 [Penicillium capsulatum]
MGDVSMGLKKTGRKIWIFCSFGRYPAQFLNRKIEALESRLKELTTDRVSLREASWSHSDSAQSTGSGPIIDADASNTDPGDPDVVDQGLLSMEAAESYLHAFKTILTPNFPFVVVPPQMSAKELRQDHPFLFLAVLAAASYENMPLQRLLGTEVKRAISTRMILNGEISLDLLQGLLLAVSLIIEMRMDRSPQRDTWKTKLRFSSDGDQDEPPESQKSWGNAEKRALIGCYYLSSTIALLVQKHSTLPYTPYIEDCCQSLRDSGEYPHDKDMMYLVQLQHIAEKIDRLSTSHGSELTRSGSGFELYIANIKSELDGFHSRLHFEIGENPFLAIHFHATGLCLYQLAVHLAGSQAKPQLNPSQPWRDEMSCAALTATESILNLYLSLPLKREQGFNNTQWVQMGFAMLVGLRQTVAASQPEQVVSFSHLLAQMQQRITALSGSDVDMNGARDVFCGFSRRVAHIQARLQGNRKEAAPIPNQNLPTLLDFSSNPWGGPSLQYGPAEVAPWPGAYWPPTTQGDLSIPDDLMFDIPMDQMMGFWT